MPLTLAERRTAWCCLALAAVTFAAQYIILSGARP